MSGCPVPSVAAHTAEFPLESGRHAGATSRSPSSSAAPPCELQTPGPAWGRQPRGGGGGGGAWNAAPRRAVGQPTRAPPRRPSARWPVCSPRRRCHAAAPLTLAPRSTNSLVPSPRHSAVTAPAERARVPWQRRRLRWQPPRRPRAPPPISSSARPPGRPRVCVAAHWTHRRPHSGAAVGEG